MLVAEKLNRFHALLQLCYRLSTDKPKASATSIQTDEEYAIFLSQMRLMIVPQRLQSGKISGRQLKPFTVVFVDGSEDKMISDAPAGGSKKVCQSVTLTKRLTLNCVCRAPANPQALNHQFPLPMRMMIPTALNEWQLWMIFGRSGAALHTQKRRTYFAGHQTTCVIFCLAKIFASGLSRLYVLLFLPCNANLLTNDMIIRLGSVPQSKPNLALFTSTRLAPARGLWQDLHPMLGSVVTLDGMVLSMPLRQCNTSHNIRLRGTCHISRSKPLQWHSPNSHHIQSKFPMSSHGANISISILAEIVMGSSLLRSVNF